METQELLAIEVNKSKIQKVMHLYNTKSERETIDQILDDIISVEDMRKTMEQYKGKGTFKKVYE